MDRAADIIPISSRRSSTQPPMLLDEPIRGPAAPRKRNWWALALVVAGLALVAAVAVSRAELMKSVRNLPPPERAALYRRTLTDIDTTCRALEAREGALREHCLSQAEFLMLFPDCDAHCQQMAASILPHARR